MFCKMSWDDEGFHVWPFHDWEKWKPIEATVTTAFHPQPHEVTRQVRGCKRCGLTQMRGL